MLTRDVAEDQLGRAAADVEDERPVVERADAAPRERGLLVAVEEARREAEPPLDLAEELAAVLGVAHRARRDRERPLGAERVGLGAEVGEHREDALDRRPSKPPRRVDALAEGCDDAAAGELVDNRPMCTHGPLLTRDVGDEQPGGVRAEVDRRDARQLRRSFSTPNTFRASWAASAMIRASAIDACRRAVAASRRAVDPGAAASRDSIAATRSLTATTSGSSFRWSPRSARHVSSPLVAANAIPATLATTRNASEPQAIAGIGGSYRRS